MYRYFFSPFKTQNIPNCLEILTLFFKKNFRAIGYNSWEILMHWYLPFVVGLSFEIHVSYLIVWHISMVEKMKPKKRWKELIISLLLFDIKNEVGNLNTHNKQLYRISLTKKECTLNAHIPKKEEAKRTVHWMSEKKWRIYRFVMILMKDEIIHHNIDALSLSLNSLNTQKKNINF